jgi:hypothetical protein
VAKGWLSARETHVEQGRQLLYASVDKDIEQSLF